MRRGNCVVAAGIRAAGSQKVWLKSLATGGTFLEDTLLPKYCFTFRFWGMGGRGWGAPLTLFMLNKMFAKQTNIWVWPFLYSFTQVISLRIQGFKYWQIKTKKTVTHPNLKKNNFKRIIFHPLLNLMVNPWIWTSCSYRIGSSTKFALICIVQVHCTSLHCSSYPLQVYNYSALLNWTSLQVSSCTAPCDCTRCKFALICIVQLHCTSLHC